MLQYQTIILFVLVTVSLILPLKFKWYWRLLLAAITALCAAKPFIYNYTGNWRDPNLPAWLITVMESLYAALLIAAVCALVADIILLGYFISCRLMKDKCKWRFNLVSGIIAAVALLQGFYGTYSQFDIPEIKVQRLAVNNLPDDLQGLRIVQLSDIHLGPTLKGEFLEGVVSRVNELQPDLVLLTGDLVDGSPEKMFSEFSAFKELKAKYGIYAVSGNHEYYSGFRQWQPLFEELGLTFLHNRSAVIQIGDFSLNLAGVPDRRAAGFGFEGPDVRNALADIDPEAAYTILMTHQPATALETEGRADLVVAGHTHGGTMFFLQPVVGYFNAGFVTGFYQLPQGGRLYVSNGTGVWSGFPCRVGVNAEITCFVLTKA